MNGALFPSRWRPGLPTRTSHRWTYAAIGLSLALGAPLGLLLLRTLQRRAPPAEVLRSKLRRDAAAYAYLTVSTATVFTGFGWVLGATQDRLRAAALADPLTGLANRRCLMLLLDHELARSSREGTDLSLLMVDVDDLKRINDRGGHAAGDRALLRVAAALRTACRRSDLAARLGGDEFVVLATGSAPSEALRLAERIRAGLAAEAGSPRVSIGVAHLADASGDAPSLLATADSALYAAKTAGRNRVVEAERPRDTPGARR